MVNFTYYNPSKIFQDSNVTSLEMIGANNFALAEAFYHSRYNIKGGFAKQRDTDNFERNAGAVQLFNKDSITTISSKEYHCMSYGNKKLSLNKTPSSYVLWLDFEMTLARFHRQVLAQIK